MSTRSEQARQRLGLALRRVRLDSDLRVSDVAALADGLVSASHISNIEAGRYGPSRTLIEWYRIHVGGGPELVTLHREMEQAIADDRADRLGASAEVAESEGAAGVNYAEMPHDADEERDDTLYLRDLSIPDGLIVHPGQHLHKGWLVRNVGSVPWVDRYLTRVGPRGGPGNLSSARSVPIADTPPGETVEMWVDLRAPRMRSNPVAYFKMTDAQGRLYWPTRYPHGVMCIVVVAESE